MTRREKTDGGNQAALNCLRPFFARLADTATLRCGRYRALVAEQVLPEEIDEIRTYTRQQRVYGSDMFRRQIEVLTTRVVIIRTRGRLRPVPVAEK